MKRTITLLCEHGADANQKNNQGNTALHEVVAKTSVQPSCIQLILNKVIILRNQNIFILNNFVKKVNDKNAKNNQGDTPLIKSSRQGNEVAVKLLLECLSLDEINETNLKGIIFSIFQIANIEEVNHRI